MTNHIIFNLKRGIRRFFKNFYFLLVFLFVKIFLFFKKSTKSNDKKILIVKLDAIGDYILFHNFLEQIKKSEKYKDYQTTFLGNELVCSLAQWLDKKYVDKFIWINKQKLSSNPFYLPVLLYKLMDNYDLAVQASFSRDFISDLIIKSSNAIKRISFKGDTNNISIINKKITDYWYTKLIEINNNLIFEFDKNKYFFEQILENNIKLIRPSISLNISETDDWFKNNNLPNKYIIIFPGAGQIFRRWPLLKFAQLATYVKEKYGFETVIVGSSNDGWMATEIKKNFPNMKLIDFFGKTDLKQLVFLISRAELLVSNDTSAAHIGASLDVKTITLSQFNHYGRFVPYSDATKSSVVCVTPNMYQELNQKELSQKFAYGSNIDINLINVLDVEKVVDKILNKKDPVNVGLF